jgi:hypothetical protein
LTAPLAPEKIAHEDRQRAASTRKEHAMENDRYARYGAATGIVAVILLIVGFSVFSKGIPGSDDSAQKWASFFTDHQNRIQTGITIVGVGLFFYIWFLGSVRSAIAAAEGGTGRIASIAYGGGLVSAAGFFITLGGTAAAAFRPQELDPTVTRALYDFGALAAAPAAAGFTALFAATAVGGYRFGAFPAPVAGLAALGAIGQPFAFLTTVTDSGAFAPDGVLGLWVPFVTFVIAVLALSGTMMRAAGASGGAAQAAQ